jgi:hypothetical protein
VFLAQVGGSVRLSVDRSAENEIGSSLKREDTKCLLRVGWVVSDTGAVFLTVFDMPFERVSCKDKYAPVVLAFRVELVVT